MAFGSAGLSGLALRSWRTATLTQDSYVGVLIELALGIYRATNQQTHSHAQAFIFVVTKQHCKRCKSIDNQTTQEYLVTTIAPSCSTCPGRTMEDVRRLLWGRLHTVGAAPFVWIFSLN